MPPISLQLPLNKAVFSASPWQGLAEHDHLIHTKQEGNRRHEKTNWPMLGRGSLANLGLIWPSRSYFGRSGRLGYYILNLIEKLVSFIYSKFNDLGNLPRCGNYDV